jgi:glycosyltransferase involved in cell wall biosynthesis
MNPIASGRPYRLAVDGRPFSGPQSYTGTTTYLESILEPLLEAGFEITLLTNRPIEAGHRILKRCKAVVFGGTRNYHWETWEVGSYLAKHDFDLYFAGSNQGIPWKRLPRTRRILGYLDVIPFKFPIPLVFRGKGYFLRHYLLGQLTSVFRTDEIVTISKQSAHDIKRLFHRQNVTNLGFNLAKQDLPKNTPKQSQFVYVGGEAVRKRLGSLLKAFASFHQEHPEFRLVMVGEGYDRHGKVSQKIALLRLKGAVTVTGYINNEEKFRVITESIALVYPSRYEGYGLAIAEGLQADVPVIAGAGGAQREVGGKAVLYIDPDDPTAIAKAMNEVLDPAVQQRLAKERHEQLRRIEAPEIAQDIVTYFNRQGHLARAGHHGR